MKLEMKLCMLMVLVFPLITHSQNIGLGINNPKAQLHVNGSTRSDNLILSDGVFSFKGTQSHFDTKPLIRYSEASKVLTLAEVLYVSSSGKVGYEESHLDFNFYTKDTAYSTSNFLVPEIRAFNDTDVFVFEDGHLKFIDNTLRISGSKQVEIRDSGSQNVVGVSNNLVSNAGLRIGTGSYISKISRSTISYDTPHISRQSFHFHTFFVEGAEVGSSAFVSPAEELSGELSISQVYVSEPNKVRVKFINEGASGQDLDPMNFYFTVIK